MQSLLLRAAQRVTHHAALNLQSLSFFLSALAHARLRRSLCGADVAVTMLEGDAVLFSRYLARHGVASVYYFSGGVDAKWAFRDRSTLRLAISQTVAGQAARQHGYATQGVVTPGIPRHLVDGPLAAGREDAAEHLIYVGRLERNKGVDRLLPLVEAILPQFPQATLTLIGDGPERPHLEKQVRQRGLEGRVVFAGTMAPAQVYRELYRADLFLFPSSYESFGLAVLEAMAAGVPVVASELPALREATGGYACLLPPDALSAWADSVRRLLVDKTQRRAVADAGRLWASQFTWDKVVQRFETFLSQACEPKNQGR